MKRYDVTVPITGYICAEVEANSEEEAISAAIENASLKDIETWSAISQIVIGNVFYGELNEAEATEIPD